MCTSMLLEVVEFFESIERDQRIVEIYSKTMAQIIWSTRRLVEVLLDA